MVEVELDRLPQFTPWVHRLLGIEGFEQRNRTISTVWAEYDGDKYRKCLAYYESCREKPSVEQIKIFELGGNASNEICISREGRLFKTTLSDARETFSRLLYDAMSDSIETADTVVELGCGYGYNLFRLSERIPGKEYLGGELSKNAVKLASSLYREYETISIREFNYYDADSYSDLLSRDKLIVFTSHSVEQLKSTSAVIETLTRFPNIQAVFHFEPVYELYDGSSLLDSLRQRYCLLNDYNRDLLSSIKQRARVVTTLPDRIGVNPLNPTALIVWKFG